MSGVAGADMSELLLVPYRRAIEMQGRRDVTLTVITPPYPVLGLGPLRVVRVIEKDDAVHFDLAYDDYERLT